MDKVTEKQLVEGFREIAESLKKQEKEQKRVIVLNKEGIQLDSCSEKRARILLERDQAKIVSYLPFTIQLTKEIENVKEEKTTIDMRSGHTYICLSSFGENRTDFMLSQAFELTESTDKVLFVSTVYNENSLNDLIEQKVSEMKSYPFERITPIVAPSLSIDRLESLINDHKPKIVIVDYLSIKEESSSFLRRIAKANQVSIYIGVSIKERKRMPRICDLPKTSEIAQDSSVILGLHGNQMSILKNRFGTTSEEKAAHKDHLHFGYIAE